MASQLNIKDPETIRLARKMAASRGKSVTAVIRSALEREDRREQADFEALSARWKALGEDIRRNLPPEMRGTTSRELQDAIYDDYGAPI